MNKNPVNFPFLHIMFLLSCLAFLSCEPQYSIPDVPEQEYQKDLEPDSILALCWQRLAQLRSLHADQPGFPRSWNSQTESLTADPAHVWTVGFYPGLAWKAWYLTGDSSWRREAMRFLPGLASQAANTSTHDLGFMLFLGLGKGLEKNPEISAILGEAAGSLFSRFDSNMGAIKSYDTSSPDEFPVIIDNLINLELLIWSGDSGMIQAVRQHAAFTQKYLLRKAELCSSHHKVILSKKNPYNPKILAGQGAHPESVWSRGLAWGIYGYTMLYRYLGDPDYLKSAQCLAAYWIEHIPADCIPYWDFEAERIPNEAKDASAAAVASAALLELATLSTHSDKGKEYFSIGEKTLKSLTSDIYFMPKGIPFILDHSTLSVPHEIDIDKPQVMADYYFIEALERYKEAVRHFEASSTFLNQASSPTFHLAQPQE